MADGDVMITQASLPRRRHAPGLWRRWMGIDMLSLYLSKNLTLSLLVIWPCMVTLLQVFDLLNNSDEIIARHPGESLPLLTYALLRFPETATFLLPFSVLLAALTTLTRLARHNEVLALKSAGLSYYRLLLRFIPAALIIGGIQFALADRAVPWAQIALIDWDTAPRDFNAASQSNEVSWLRDGNDIIRLEKVLQGGRVLQNITIFRRDAQTAFVERIEAPQAHYTDKQWHLTGATILSYVNEKVATRSEADFIWRTGLRPNYFSDLSSPPTALHFKELLSFARTPDLGGRPAIFYETWLHRRLALPLTTIIMILLAAPVAQGLQRRGNLWGHFAAGIGLAFLYFILDGALLALGQSGGLPAVVASWSPAVIFAVVGISMLLRVEHG